MPIEVRWEGVDGLLRQARGLGAQGEKARRAATLAGAKIIVEEAKRRAPRSANPRGPTTSKSSWRTGQHMADVLNAEVVPRKTKTFAGVTTPGGVANGPYFYIRFLEYGTKYPKKHKKAGQVHVKASHFVGESAKAREGEIVDTVARTLKTGMDL